jgi:hypothetical protein
MAEGSDVGALDEALYAPALQGDPALDAGVGVDISGR